MSRTVVAAVTIMLTLLVLGTYVFIYNGFDDSARTKGTDLRNSTANLSKIAYSEYNQTEKTGQDVINLIESSKLGILVLNYNTSTSGYMVKRYNEDITISNETLQKLTNEDEELSKITGVLSSYQVDDDGVLQNGENNTSEQENTIEKGSVSKINKKSSDEYIPPYNNYYSTLITDDDGNTIGIVFKEIK